MPGMELGKEADHQFQEDGVKSWFGGELENDPRQCTAYDSRNVLWQAAEQRRHQHKRYLTRVFDR
eukprot:10393161-Prorocentrum_lima.AAC.1